jgi:hypothetical protein
MKTFHKIFLFTLLIVCLSAACLGSHTSSKSHKWTHKSSKTHSKSVLGNIKNIGRNNLGNNAFRKNLGNHDNKKNLGNHVCKNNLGNNDNKNNLNNCNVCKNILSNNNNKNILSNNNNKNNLNNNNSHSSKVSKKSVSISKSVSLKQNIKFSYLSTKKISFDLSKQFSNKASVNKSNFSKK